MRQKRVRVAGFIIAAACLTIATLPNAGAANAPLQLHSRLAIATSTPLYVACVGSDVCVVVGAGVAAWSSDGGIKWSLATSPPPSSILADGVACGTDCILVGNTSNGRRTVVMRSTDGGRSWVNVPNSLAGGTAFIACASATVCFTNTGRTTNAGRTWSKVKPWAVTDYGNRVTAESVSCASKSLCVGVGWTPVPTYGSPPSIAMKSFSVVSADAGKSWKLGSNGFGYDQVTGISCSGHICWASGFKSPHSTKVFETANGTHWTLTGTEPKVSESQVDSIACVRRTCTVLGSGAAQVSTSTDAGTTWSMDMLPSNDLVPSAVAVTAGGRVVVLATSDPQGTTVILSS